MAGIDIFIHFSFFLSLTWVAFIQWELNGSIGAAFSGVVFILAIFACVVLHELGHALAAKKYGIKTQDIILLPIGRVARLEKMPNLSIQELWVALAGPAVNVGIAALLATRLAYTRATRISANLGQGIALLFGVIGLFYNPILLFIAFFVWMGAAQETRMVRMKSVLDRIP